MGKLELRLEKRGKTEYFEKPLPSGDSLPLISEYESDTYGLYDTETNKKVSKHNFYYSEGMFSFLNTSFTYLPNGYYVASIVKSNVKTVDVLINPKGQIERKGLKGFTYLGDGKYSIKNAFGRKVIKEVKSKKHLEDKDFLEAGLSLSDMKKVNDMVLASQKSQEEMTREEKVSWQQRKRAKVSTYLKGYTYDDLSGARTGESIEDFNKFAQKIKEDKNYLRYYNHIKETKVCLDLDEFPEEFEQIEKQEMENINAQNQAKTKAKIKTTDMETDMEYEV